MDSSERERLFSPPPQSSTASPPRNKHGDEFELSSLSLSTNDEPPSTMQERIRNSLWFPVSFIFAFSFFITVVEHGVRSNVVLYTEDVLEYTRGNSPILLAAFDAIAPCLPLIGGWLGDAWFTRSKVMVSGALTSFIGILLLTINVAPYSDDIEENFSLVAKRALFVVGFTLIFIGYALYEANDYVMAAREIGKRKEQREERIRNMFCIFYIVYFSAVTSSEILFGLVNATSFFFVYLLLAASVILAIASVLIGRKFYVTEQRNKSTLWNQFRIIWEGVSRRKDAPRVHKWIDRASTKHGGSFTPAEVYETSHLLRTLPIFHTVTIFVIVNYFIENTYPKQTLLLKPVRDDITTAGLLFKLYQPIISILTNVITLTVLYPCTSRWGRAVSPFIRISLGILFGIISVALAAIVEAGRKSRMMEEGGVIIALVNNTTYNASSLSVTSQIPQYTSAGIAEAFVLTAGVEIAYVEAPCHLKGFTVGLFLLMSGVGSYILAQLIVVIVNAISAAASGQDWYTDNPNSSKLEYFYCILAAILTLDILYVYLVTRSYERADWEGLTTKARTKPGTKLLSDDDGGDDAREDNRINDDDAIDTEDMPFGR